MILYYIEFFYDNIICKTIMISQYYTRIKKCFTNSIIIYVFRQGRQHKTHKFLHIEQKIVYYLRMLMVMYFYNNINVHVKVRKGRIVKKFNYNVKKHYIMNNKCDITQYSTYKQYHAGYEKYMNCEDMPTCCIICYKVLRVLTTQLTYMQVCDYVPIKILKSTLSKKEQYLNMHYTAISRTAYVCTLCYSYVKFYMPAGIATSKYKPSFSIWEVKRLRVDEFLLNKQRNIVILYTYILKYICFKLKKRISKHILSMIVEYMVCDDVCTNMYNINFWIAKIKDILDY